MFCAILHDSTFKAGKKLPVHLAMAAQENDFLPGSMIKKEPRL
jgi:hypothetical protein